MSVSESGAIEIDLTAVLVAVTDDEPRVLTIQDGRALPSGPFESGHRSLQTGLRSWVERQTHHPLDYVEQLYTFADRDRTLDGARVIAISYLGLTREAKATRRAGSRLAQLVPLPAVGGLARGPARFHAGGRKAPRCLGGGGP